MLGTTEYLSGSKRIMTMLPLLMPDSIGYSGTDNVRRISLDSSLSKNEPWLNLFPHEHELIVLHAPSARPYSWILVERPWESHHKGYISLSSFLSSSNQPKFRLNLCSSAGERKVRQNIESLARMFVITLKC